MRIEKIAILDEVVARVNDSDYCFIVNYGGVEVGQIAKFRAALRAQDSRLLVVKNTYLAKVAKDKGWSEEVNAMFVGPTAVVTGHGEPTAVAKAIMDFVNGSAGKASVKGADYDGKIVDAAMVDALSKVPGKDQLRATLLMLLKEPATRLARVLSEKAKKEGGAPAEAPAEPPAA
ncbi:MAG: 50S ribosomal protein L10 [Kiritimatiellae bacterium]|nr:50S ribosomal protein L10 [Kiritimatiellia bacterium]MBQ3341130.1 50S ribosomal protein L10 [Kiritimatiellia bacterium]